MPFGTMKITLSSRAVARTLFVEAGNLSLLDTLWSLKIIFQVSVKLGHGCLTIFVGHIVPEVTTCAMYGM